MIRYLKAFADPFPKVSQFYRNTRDLLDRNNPSIKTPWGFQLAGHPAMAAGTFEPSETQLVRELLQEVDILVNVGANVGYYCCHALSMGKAVIAVEPIARNLHYLLRNIYENGWSAQAEVFSVALGAQASILKMWGGGTGASLVEGWAGIPKTYVTQVPVLTLDRILGNALDGKRALILVDVEGAEYPLLRGAMKTLKHAPRPLWMVEISSTTHQPQGLTFNPHLVSTFDLLFDHGYAAFTADADLKPIDANMVRKVYEGRDEFGTHNFIFREKISIA